MQDWGEPITWEMVSGKTLREEGNKSNGNILVEFTSNPTRTDESNQEKKKNSDSRHMSKEITDELKSRHEKPIIFIIDPGSHTIPNTIKRIKTGTDKNRVQDNITKIRAMKNGGLLVQVRGDQKTMEGVIEYVTKAAGTDTQVVEQKLLLEIRDIDEWLTKKGNSRRIITKREFEKRLSEYNKPQKQV